MNRPFWGSMIALVGMVGCSESSTEAQPGEPIDAGSDPEEIEASVDGAKADATADAPLDSPADSPTSLTYQPDTVAEGAAIYLEVDTSQAEPAVRVMGKQLGLVFGIALHVQYEGNWLAAHDPTAAQVFGADAPDAGRYLVKARTSDVAYGGVRRSVAGGEVNITSPILLATIPLTLNGAGETRLTIQAAQVRKADGSFVTVATTGGVLRMGGAP